MEIISVLESLSEEQKREVYDFVEFIKNKKEKKREINKDLINKLCGISRGWGLTTERFCQMKEEEIELEERKFRNE